MDIQLGIRKETPKGIPRGIRMGIHLESLFLKTEIRWRQGQEVPVMYLKWRNGAKYRIRWKLARSIQNGDSRAPIFQN